MLDRVETAFATQRDFLDDAGHELRTPITVLRGHLELVEPGDPLPEDTRSLLLDELERMSRIVDDLVTIAKSERPDFVAGGPVDVADLTLDIADKARALATRDWRVVTQAMVVADPDRQRIVPAWMNLARNAARHTSANDTITILSRLRAGQLESSVVDTGGGVADEDRARIFERFSRGSSARGIDADGLGLAIVNAISLAHGGTVRLDDTPGGGATFTIRITLDTAPNTSTENSEVAPWPAS